MKKITILFSVLTLSFLSNSASADTSTDKIVTIQVPVFKNQPLNADSALPAPVKAGSTATTLVPELVPKVVVQPPAFLSPDTPVSGTVSTTNTTPEPEAVAVKPVKITPQTADEQLPASVTNPVPKTNDYAPTGTQTIQPAPVQNFSLATPSPGKIWKFGLTFSVLFFILIAYNRITLRKNLNK